MQRAHGLTAHVLSTSNEKLQVEARRGHVRETRAAPVQRRRATCNAQRDVSPYSAEVSAASGHGDGDGNGDGEVVRIKYHLRLAPLFTEQSVGLSLGLPPTSPDTRTYVPGRGEAAVLRGLWSWSIAPSLIDTFYSRTDTRKALTFL